MVFVIISEENHSFPASRSLHENILSFSSEEEYNALLDSLGTLSDEALGQKNTVLAIWMAYTYLNPLSSVGPGSYVLWQNIINSYQLWKKRKNETE